MMILVTGGSGSGKSEYAENRIVELAEDCDRYYIATMQVYDEEGQKRITRHHQMRSGKGFATIEQQTDIEKSIKKNAGKQSGQTGSPAGVHVKSCGK